MQAYNAIVVIYFIDCILIILHWLSLWQHTYNKYISVKLLCVSFYITNHLVNLLNKNHNPCTVCTNTAGNKSPFYNFLIFNVCFLKENGTSKFHLFSNHITLLLVLGESTYLEIQILWNQFFRILNLWQQKLIKMKRVQSKRKKSSKGKDASGKTGRKSFHGWQKIQVGSCKVYVAFVTMLCYKLCYKPQVTS